MNRFLSRAASARHFWNSLPLSGWPNIPCYRTMRLPRAGLSRLAGGLWRHCWPGRAPGWRAVLRGGPQAFLLSAAEASDTRSTHRGATRQSSPGDLRAVFYWDLEFGAEALVSKPHSCGCQKPQESPRSLRKARSGVSGQGGVLRSTGLSRLGPRVGHRARGQPLKTP